MLNSACVDKRVYNFKQQQDVFMHHQTNLDSFLGSIRQETGEIDGWNGRIGENTCVTVHRSLHQRSCRSAFHADEHAEEEGDEDSEEEYDDDEEEEESEMEEDNEEEDDDNDEQEEEDEENSDDRDFIVDGDSFSIVDDDDSFLEC